MHLRADALKPHALLLRCFGSLAHSAIRHPVPTLLIVALITLATAPGIWRLKLRTDGHALVTPDAPEVIYDAAIRKQFGIEDNLVVLIRATQAAGIFHPATLQLVRDLTADLLKLPGISAANVMSLATEPSFRMRPGTLIHQTMLEPPLRTPVELDQLRDDLSKIQLYTSTYVAPNGKSTVILVGVPAECDRTRLYQQVLDIIATRKASQKAPDRIPALAVKTTAKDPAGPLHANGEKPPLLPFPALPEDVTISVAGAPVAESLLGIHILEDLGVPRSWLGTTTRANPQATGWKFPSSLYKLRLQIAHHIGLVPVAALVMMLILLASFRNVVAMLIPLPGVLATMLFVFGMMGWWGVPVYLTIAVMPVLLVATGVTNDIYIFSRYFSLFRQHPVGDHREWLGKAFDQMAAPVAITSLTTCVGFFSFGLSPLGPVRAFGICTGIGVLFGLLYSFSAVPALLTLVPPGWLAARHGSNRALATEGRLAAWFARLAPAVVRGRWGVVGGTVLTAALLPLGLRQLRVQDSWTDAFDLGSEFRLTTKAINDNYFGIHLLLVTFDDPKRLEGELPASAVTSETVLFPANLVEGPAIIAGSPITLSLPGNSTNQTNPVWHSHIEMALPQGETILARMPRQDAAPAFAAEVAKLGRAHFDVVAQTHADPAVIRAIADLAAYIRQRSQYAVGGVLSPADYLVTTRFMARPNDPGARVLPTDGIEMKLMWNYYGLALGNQRLRQIVDTNYWRSLTTVFLKDANFADTAKLMSDIQAYAREHLAPKGIKLGFAGDVALSQSLIQGIVATQLHSLIWSLAGIFLVTAVLGRSVKWGIYCVAPSLLAVLVKFAVMGWVDIPLGVATSMFAAMTLGIGVNCAIQLLESYRLAQAEGKRGLDSLSRAMSLTGPPALINTLAVSLGFGVLMLSQVPANARLGFLVVLGLTWCLIISLLLVPLLLHWWPIGEDKVTILDKQ